MMDTIAHGIGIDGGADYGEQKTPNLENHSRCPHKVRKSNWSEDILRRIIDIRNNKDMCRCNVFMLKDIRSIFIRAIPYSISSVPFTTSGMNEGLEECVAFYNQHRLHTSIAYQPTCV